MYDLDKTGIERRDLLCKHLQGKANRLRVVDLPGLEYQESHGKDVSECLVLEDSESGVCAAKKAGCSVIAVPTKWTKQQDFHMADFVLDCPDAETIVRSIEEFL